MENLLSKNKFLPEFFTNQLMIGLIGKLKADGFHFYSPESQTLIDRNDQILERHLIKLFADEPLVERKFYAGLRKLARAVGIISKRANNEVIGEISAILSGGGARSISKAMDEEIIL